jgi:hypothetical protein
VRLVVFNLDQQKEIFREEHFHSDQMSAVSQAVFDLQLATVDYRQLQNPAGSPDLLERLAKEELREKDRSDAVVFLGPRTRWNGGDARDLRKEHTTPLQYQIARLPVSSREAFDTADRAVGGHWDASNINGFGRGLSVNPNTAEGDPVGTGSASLHVACGSTHRSYSSPPRGVYHPGA